MTALRSGLLTSGLTPFVLSKTLFMQGMSWKFVFMQRIPGNSDIPRRGGPKRGTAGWAGRDRAARGGAGRDRLGEAGRGGTKAWRSGAPSAPPFVFEPPSEKKRPRRFRGSTKVLNLMQTA